MFLKCIYIFALIVPAHFNSRNGLAMPQIAQRITITCGQNYVTDTFAGFLIVQITCPLFNGTDTTVTAFKDGEELPGLTGDIIYFGPFSRPDDTIFGTYTFILSNNCSQDIAVTRILRQGKFLSQYTEMFTIYIIM